LGEIMYSFRRDRERSEEEWSKASRQECGLRVSQRKEAELMSEHSAEQPTPPGFAWRFRQI
jgi:hypothetical protein